MRQHTQHSPRPQTPPSTPQSSRTHLQVAEQPAVGVSRRGDSPATTAAVLNVAAAFDADYPFREVTQDSDLYHLRQGEAPGRWTGTGAAVPPTHDMGRRFGG